MKSKNKKLKKTSKDSNTKKGKHGLKFVRQEKIKHLPLLHVEWKDHAVNKGSWASIDEIKVLPVIVCSVGYLVDEDKEAIAIAQSVSNGGNVSDTLTILKSCIVEKKEL